MLFRQFPQSTGLKVSVSHVDGDEHVLSLGQCEYRLVTGQVLVCEPASADLDAVKTVCFRQSVFFIETGDAEAVRKILADFPQVSVLIPVDIFLGDDRSADAGKIHVRQQPFRAVDAVCQVRREHLPDFIAEHAAAAAQVIDGKSVDLSVLFQP